MEIVVNEWLLEYLRSDARQEDKALASEFVNDWLNARHKVVIKRNSPFTSKFYRYMGQSTRSIACRKRFSSLFQILFVDSDRTRILDDCDITSLPPDLVDKVPSDDLYLIELWHSVPGSVVVTTDEKLRQKLREHDSSAKIYLLQEFLRMDVAQK